jgi:hypothetical protein
MDASTEITKYTIVIIQSLKDGDLKTGKILHDTLSASLPKKYPDTTVKFYDVKDKKELAVAFHEIYNGIEEGELITLQIEAHGCEDGVDLASGELVTWQQFFGVIRPINVKMLNLLLVCMSMCYGGALISHLEPEKRAPYRAFIGAGSTIKAGVLLDGFSAFYENYHHLLDSFAAFEAMKKATIDANTGRSPFWMMTSEDVFQRTLDPDRDPDNFKHIVSEQYVKQKIEGKDITREQVAKEVRDLLAETYKRYYENFTFRDLIPKDE